MSQFHQIEPLSKLELGHLVSLRKFLLELKQVCIAYSGGVDSSLVAAIAHEQLGSKAFAVTGLSPALAPTLLNEARQQAKWIGICHEECITQELENPSYSNNPQNRCYACKTELHGHLNVISKKAGNFQLIDGVNLDDLADYRPGLKAGQEAGVISPLAELKIGKQSIRKISKALGFPWWDKPAQPCLASRFPYGQKITKENLQKVGEAEAWLRSIGFKEVRVRCENESARIEVPEEQVNDLLVKSLRSKILIELTSIGFKSVSIDIEGLISGKLNR